ncbi:acyl carrier protein [Amycolatopsis sp. K13G38]|uniref:Acyl carrier protein n=2 Tax=Amycolatopsis acididurans TaxID=2724524 RepID=A0ABX1JGJ1_9PSEU|nr:acyl carrier protein [Amycolatopsis acididurans]
MLHEILEDNAVEDIEITPASTFYEGLGLESIDLVALAGMLADHYGEQVNLAEFLAEKELDEIVALTVGQLADYVASRV